MRRTGRLDAIVPPLVERELPGLSATLTGPIDPRRCRCCGSPHVAAVPLTRWVECDPWDCVPARPSVVVLCKRCADRLIEPHPRLYKQLDTLDPFPGCMSVCVHCVHRAGTSCRAPAAKINGGPGLAYGWKDGKQPASMHVCSRPGGCRTMVVWPGKVETCSGRAVAQLVTNDPHPGDPPPTEATA